MIRSAIDGGSGRVECTSVMIESVIATPRGVFASECVRRKSQKSSEDIPWRVRVRSVRCECKRSLAHVRLGGGCQRRLAKAKHCNASAVCEWKDLLLFGRSSITVGIERKGCVCCAVQSELMLNWLERLCEESIEFCSTPYPTAFVRSSSMRDLLWCWK